MIRKHRLDPIFPNLDAQGTQIFFQIKIDEVEAKKLFEDTSSIIRNNRQKLLYLCTVVGFYPSTIGR
jgi:hypothetical protein